MTQSPIFWVGVLFICLLLAVVFGVIMDYFYESYMERLNKLIDRG